MIAPKDHFIWHDLQESVFEWVAAIEARQAKTRPRDPRREDVTRSLLNSYLVASFLDAFPPLLYSTQSGLLRASPFLFLHADRLDACSMPSFSTARAEYALFYERGDKGVFLPSDIEARFCAIDIATGTIRLKNNSKGLFLSAWLEEGEATAAVSMATSLQGMSLCWCPSSLPNSQFEVISRLGLEAYFNEQALDLPAEKGAVRPRGRPRETPEILAAYDEIYPDGRKASGDYWDTVARKLSDHLGKPVKKETVARAINQRDAEDGIKRVN